MNYSIIYNGDYVFVIKDGESVLSIRKHNLLVIDDKIEKIGKSLFCKQ